jgi:hypothetical protein
MRKATTYLAGASVIALLALTPATVSANPRHHGWNWGPDVSIDVGLGGIYYGHRHYRGYSYD